ncbi:MAG: hypothetical protein IV100_14535 [Myxococcales bacterium]|nr:hypothetical protein [Myxococcales bacterium]
MLRRCQSKRSWSGNNNNKNSAPLTCLPATVVSAAEPPCSSSNAPAGALVSSCDASARRQHGQNGKKKKKKKKFFFQVTVEQLGGRVAALAVDEDAPTPLPVLDLGAWSGVSAETRNERASPFFVSQPCFKMAMWFAFSCSRSCLIVRELIDRDQLFFFFFFFFFFFLFFF